ncbi:MAG: MotA/TolQ/ExbB proton channel family protein [Romboutsia sp.]|uniref:MotA/TolQ/ExbB proton channel family protein n=1 Tax=Romboutsia sp. TaxID=1965302 RepID=UPI003F3E353C
MSSTIINGITCVFLVITIGYSVLSIIANKNLYNHISDDYKKLNEDYKRSILYSNVKNKHNTYLVENSYAEVNITTFIEEVCTGFTFKNRPILEKIKAIKNSSSTCILLGVLGTFVGLSLMLLTINTNDIINSLPATISSMQTAFITSICGIVCSIVINIILGYHDCEQILLQLMLKCENLLTSEVSHQKSQSIDDKIEDVKNTIKQISKSIESIEKFDQISKDLHDFNNEFISGIEALKNLLLGSQDSIKTFDQSVRKLDKQMNIMNIKFGKLFDKYDTQEDINKEILIDIKETSKNIFESTENQYKIREYIRNLSASFALYERTAQDLLSKLVNHEKQITDTQANLNNEQINLDDTVRHLASIIALSTQDIDQKLNLIFDYIDIYKEAATMESMKNNNHKKYEDEIYDMDRHYEKHEYERGSLTPNDLVKSKRQSTHVQANSSQNNKLQPRSRNRLANKSLNYLSGDDVNDK